MILTQLPSLLRQLRRKERAPQEAAALEAADSARPVELTLITTVLLFALCRQSQVLIERFLASTLPAGAISHLNYAQKVAQIPMTFSLMLCTVTLPVVAQAMAEGDTERARSRVEKDLALVSCIVLLGAAAIFACGPQMIELLFQRGAFTEQDTAATAAVMRVYALGLLGHALVSALVRSYFSAVSPPGTRWPRWPPGSSQPRGSARPPSAPGASSASPPPTPPASPSPPCSCCTAWVAGRCRSASGRW